MSAPKDRRAISHFPHVGFFTSQDSHSGQLPYLTPFSVVIAEQWSHFEASPESRVAPFRLRRSHSPHRPHSTFRTANRMITLGGASSVKSSMSPLTTHFVPVRSPMTSHNRCMLAMSWWYRFSPEAR